MYISLNIRLNIFRALILSIYLLYNYLKALSIIFYIIVIKL